MRQIGGTSLIASRKAAVRNRKIRSLSALKILLNFSNANTRLWNQALK
jgi:hypothetical protein